MDDIRYPDPTFRYQGAALTVPGGHVGPIPLWRARHVGVNYGAEPGTKAPDITIRPVEAPAHDDPCTTSFQVHYTQFRTDPLDGVEHMMVFRLTSDQKGGVVGVEAALDVESNYDEIDMAIPPFAFTQPGFGIAKEKVLPADYEATLTVRVWNRHADVAIDGWLRLECGYHREEKGRQLLVAVGRASLYPATPLAEAPWHAQGQTLATATP